MEISITPLEGWELAPVGMLIAAIGIGRMYLFYEGTALREIGTEPARIAFYMSLGISVAFAVYVGILTYLGKADWYQFSLFQLGNIVLLCVEWIFSFRQGSEVNTLLNHFRNRSLAMKSQAEKLRGKLRTSLSENSELRTALDQAKNEQNRLSSHVEALSAENSEKDEQLSALRNELSEIRKAAESEETVRNSEPNISESAIHVSESDGIPLSRLSELRTEFPDSDSEFQKILTLDSRKKALDRRRYLRNKEKAGKLNGSSTELLILEKLL